MSVVLIRSVKRAVYNNIPLEKAEEALRVAAYETDEVPIKVALAPGIRNP